MERFFITLILVLLTLSGHAKQPVRESIPKRQITNLAKEYRRYNDFHFIRVGRLGTSILKSIVKVGARSEDSFDEDTMMALSVMDGIKKVEIIEYDECRPEVQDRFNRSLNKILRDAPILLQVKDGGDQVNIYGTSSADGSIISDFVLHVPNDNVAIMLYGSISFDTIGQIFASSMR